MGFSNQQMRLPNNKFDTTPHIALIDGYWRVSPTPNRRGRFHREMWSKAHAEVQRRNNERMYGTR